MDTFRPTLREDGRAARICVRLPKDNVSDALRLFGISPLLIKDPTASSSAGAITWYKPHEGELPSVFHQRVFDGSASKGIIFSNWGSLGVLGTSGSCTSLWQVGRLPSHVKESWVISTMNKLGWSDVSVDRILPRGKFRSFIVVGKNSACTGFGSYTAPWVMIMCLLMSLHIGLVSPRQSLRRSRISHTQLVEVSGVLPLSTVLQSFFLFTCLPVRLSVCVCGCLSVCLCLSACLFVCLFVCLSEWCLFSDVPGVAAAVARALVLALVDVAVVFAGDGGVVGGLACVVVACDCLRVRVRLCFRLRRRPEAPRRIQTPLKINL